VSPSEVDLSLLKRCLAQEPGAWKDFVDRYLGLFIHVLQHTAHSRSVTISPDDIDDLCAEFFLAVLADDFAILRRFRGQSSLATYLTVIVRRIAVRAISNRRNAEALGHVRSHHPLDQIPATGNAHTRMENEDLVQRMMIGLPANEAEVLRRFHLQGDSYRQISEALGVPENSIGPMLTRARERLRQELSATL
jgi:RNA polymerase sigma-70 factor (ECF subfamily)